MGGFYIQLGIVDVRVNPTRRRMLSKKILAHLKMYVTTVEPFLLVREP